MTTKIMITHLAGRKENQIEQLRLEGLNEIVIGRDPSATIVIDGQDDLSSRRHAAIKIYRDTPDEPRFTVLDLGSQNGTYLNNERLQQESELMPGDIIEIGRGGPKLGFDLQPLPANFAARTRVMRAGAGAASTAAATRIMPAAAAPAYTAPHAAKQGVGQETVQRLISGERKSSRRTLTYALAGVLVLIAAGGGGLFYYSKVKQQAANTQINAILAENNQPKPLSAQQLAQKYGASTVIVNVSWRLYDSNTNQPLFQKTEEVDDGSNVSRVAMFIRLPNGKTVRWLTTDSDGGKNIYVGEDGQGSGFVATKDGVLITNKHVAASWMIPAQAGDLDPHGQIITLDDNLNPIVDKHGNWILSDLDNDAVVDLLSWIPGNGGWVFADDAPTPVGNGPHGFTGRNNNLNVQFPGQTTTIEARLVSFSDAADTALIKIDPATPLTPLPLAPKNDVQQGEAITVLGYPAVTPGNTMTTNVDEAGTTGSVQQDMPALTVTDGIVSVVGKPTQQIGATTVEGDMGEVDQLSDNSTGEGNSGGPVFDANGNVIGIFTYTRAAAGATVTFAVPIHFAQALLSPVVANN